MSSPRVGNPRVGVSASCPVTDAGSHTIQTMASPAMGHWGYVPSPRLPTVASVRLPFQTYLFTVLFTVILYATNNFRVILPPSPAPDPGAPINLLDALSLLDSGRGLKTSQRATPTQKNLTLSSEVKYTVNFTLRKAS